MKRTSAVHKVLTFITVSALALMLLPNVSSGSQQAEVRHLVVASGDSWTTLGRECGLTAQGLARVNFETIQTPLYAGQIVACVATATPPPTTTTLPPETTTTTTLPPETTTTTLPPTTTTVPPAAGVEFYEDFTNPAAGFDRFKQIVSHRQPSDTVWRGDHDHACGNPLVTERTIRSNVYDEYFYACSPTSSGGGHWMTSLGDTAEYSVAAFCPDVDLNDTCDAFSRSSSKTVSFDVTMTNMGGGRWWELKITPVDSDDLSVKDFLSTEHGGAGFPIHIYPPEAVIIGSGPFGGDINFHTNGQATDFGADWVRWYYQWDLNAGYNLANAYRYDHSTRVPMSVTDDGNGTITWQAGGPGYAINETWTRPGQFPEEFKVVFADHAYRPDKEAHDPAPGNYTTHYDRIEVS